MKQKELIRMGFIISLGFLSAYAAAAEQRTKMGQRQLEAFKRDVRERFFEGKYQEAFDMTRDLRSMHGATEADLLQELFDAILELPQLSDEATVVAREVIDRFTEKLKDPRVKERRDQYQDFVATAEGRLASKLEQLQSPITARRPEMPSTVLFEESPTTTTTTTTQTTEPQQTQQAIPASIQEEWKAMGRRLNAMSERPTSQKQRGAINRFIRDKFIGFSTSTKKQPEKATRQLLKQLNAELDAIAAMQK